MLRNSLYSTLRQALPRLQLSETVPSAAPLCRACSRPDRSRPACGRRAMSSSTATSPDAAAVRSAPPESNYQLGSFGSGRDRADSVERRGRQRPSEEQWGEMEEMEEEDEQVLNRKRHVLIEHLPETLIPEDIKALCGTDDGMRKSLIAGEHAAAPR